MIIYSVFQGLGLSFFHLLSNVMQPSDVRIWLNNNSTMKKLSVGETFVQRKERKGRELHFFSPTEETFLLNSFLPNI